MKNNFVGIALFAYLALAAGLSLNVRAGGELYTYMGENTLTYGYQTLEQTSSAITSVAGAVVSNPFKLLAVETGQSQNFIYGDVNNSGTVTASDVLLLNAYIAGTNVLTDDALVRADINEDREVNAVDAYLIRNIIVGNLTQSAADRKILFGDLTQDGNVDITDVVYLRSHLTPLTLQGRLAIAADLDMSGTVNTYDLSLLRSYVVGLIEKLPAKFGDLDGDYKTNLRDVVLISAGINGTRPMTQQQTTLANVYRGATAAGAIAAGDTDTTLDARDVELLRKFVVGTVTSLPITVGDVNNDGNISISDSTLISRIVNKLITPTAIQTISADIDANGVVNANDATLLNQFIVGLIKNLPVVPTPTATINVTSPNGGENLLGAVGTAPVQIRWSVQNMTANDLLNINLVDPITLNSVEIIATGIKATDGAVSWWVPSADVINPGNYKIRINCVKENDNLQARECHDVSDNSFTILSSLPTPTPTQVPAPTANQTPSAGGGGKSAVIALYDRATYRLISNSTISLYKDPSLFLGSQFAPIGVTTFYDLGNGWYTARGSAVGYNDGAQRFIVASTSPNPIRVNIFTTRGSTTPGRLNVSVQQTPAAHNITAGTIQEHFANYQFDTTGSGEDVRLVSANLQMTFNGLGGGSATDLRNCKLYDGATVVSFVVNPTGIISPANFLFTFSPAQVVARNTQKVFALKCDVGAAVHSGSTYSWGIISGNNINAVGVTSGSDIPESITPSAGQTMTVQPSAVGTLSVSTDASSPSYTQYQAGSLNVTAGVYKFRATGEDVSLQQLSVQLTSGSPTSINRVTVWDGTTIVGTGVFIGLNTTTNIVLSPAVLVQQGTDKSLTVKVDLAQIGTSYSGIDGDFIKLDENRLDDAATFGTGISSGTRVFATGLTDVAGFRMFKSFPVISLDTLPASGLTDGRLMRFRVTAGANGSVSMDKYTLLLSGAVGVNNINIYAFTDSSYSVPVPGVGSGGRMMLTGQLPDVAQIFSQDNSGAPAPIVIPSGSTYYFEARAYVPSSVSYITTTLMGEEMYPVLSTPMGTVSQVNSDVNGNNHTIWSPNGRGVSAQNDQDWANGYGILPRAGLSFTRTN